ncbi:MAG: pilus assembly protein [Desulfobacter sp.]|nr:MAG: pilus assembly protein [Desulfobacter sp.]
MRKGRLCISNSRGAATVEFALLVPVWLLLFFGMLDYAWYLTHVMVAENAVAAGARAGVTVKYWLAPDDDDYKDPVEIARDAVRHAFWLDTDLNPALIDVRFKDGSNQPAEEDGQRQYLEVKLVDYEYPPLTGYLPDRMIPRKISTIALMTLP